MPSDIPNDIKYVTEEQLQKEIKTFSDEVEKILPAMVGVKSSINAIMLKGVSGSITWENLTSNIADTLQTLDTVTVNQSAQSVISEMGTKFATRLFKISEENLEEASKQKTSEPKKRHPKSYIIKKGEEPTQSV